VTTRETDDANAMLTAAIAASDHLANAPMLLARLLAACRNVGDELERLDALSELASAVLAARDTLAIVNAVPGAEEPEPGAVVHFTPGGGRR
jgi:hypothetical protein